LFSELCYAPFAVKKGCDEKTAPQGTRDAIRHDWTEQVSGSMERYREGPAVARLSGGSGIAIRAPAMGAGLGLSTGDVPFPVMVIPTRNAFRVVPAKTSVAFSTQRITTNLRMLSLLGGDRLSETVAVLYRDGTVLSADRRAIATFAQEQQERGQSVAGRNRQFERGRLARQNGE